MEYLTMCRVCLNENLEDLSATIYDFCENSEVKFIEILNLLAPQIEKISDNEKYESICDDCKIMCREILKFQDQIITTNEALKHYLLKEPEIDDTEVLENNLESAKEDTGSDGKLMYAEMYEIVEENIYDEEIPDDKEYIKDENAEDHVNVDPDQNQCMKSHGDKGTTHSCDICGKSYKQASRLKIHMDTHSNQKSFLCTICGKSFNRNSNLRQHLLRHAGQKRFHCEQCPAKFVSKGNLKAHMTAHSNKKPYSCKICGSSFTQSYSLVKHNRIHTSDRPYGCDVCSMKFYSSDHLKRHIRTHTGQRPFKCGFCSKSFAQNGDLNKHKRLHVGENTYICEFENCNNSFRLLKDLRNHLKVHYCNNSINQEKNEETLNKFIMDNTDNSS